jgi:hypothetical protein
MPPARFLVSVDGLGNMPSNRRAVPRQSGKTLPDRLLCAVICGDVHTIGLKRASDGLFPDAGERNRHDFCVRNRSVRSGFAIQHET